MNNFMKLFGVVTLIFLILDFIWLLVISKKIYQDYLGNLLGPTKIMPAVMFYAIYVVGLLIFVVYPALEKDSLIYAVSAGAFLGVLCYGTYDLTNLATIKDWPLFITVIDLVWGGFVTAVTCGITVFIAQHFNWR